MSAGSARIASASAYKWLDRPVFTLVRLFDGVLYHRDYGDRHEVEQRQGLNYSMQVLERRGLPHTEVRELADDAEHAQMTRCSMSFTPAVNSR